jgi:hypothetical protein
MQSTVFEPPGDLERFVEYLWTLERDDDETALFVKAFATDNADPTTSFGYGS